MRCIVLLLLLLILQLVLCQNQTKEENQFHSCQLDHAISRGGDPPVPRWYEVLYPSLTCSSERWTTFNVTLPEGETDYTGIQSLTLSYKYLSDLGIDSLRDYPNLTRLHINENSLQDIEETETNFILPSLTSFILTGSLMLGIPNEALRSFPNLKYFVLYSNNFLGLDYNDFRFNRNLELLYMDCNTPPGRISYKENHWMRNVNLTTLKLWKCGVSTITPDVCGMSALKYLDLSYNSLQVLESGAFLGCSNLYELKLASNRINTIDPSAFEGATNLAKLDLSGNHLQFLPEGVFDFLNLDGLEINLYKNWFECNCRMAWFKKWMDDVMSNGISWEIYFECKVGHIYLYNRKTHHELEDEDFKCKPEAGETDSAKKLDSACPYDCQCFNRSSLTSTDYIHYYDRSYLDDFLPASGWGFGFRSESEILKLDCVDTNLTRIPVEEKLSAINELYLTGNNMKTLYLNQLRNYTNLRSLRLPGNQIEFIIPDVFLKLPSLFSIDLRSNKLKSVNSEIFIAFSSLSTIQIFHNEITHIPMDAFAYNRNLRKLFIGPNPIQSFQEDFLTNLQLTEVSLKNLSLSLIPITLGKLKQLNRLILDDNLITVVSNLSFSGCEHLSVLSLRNNRITTIENEAFRGLSRIKVIDLSLNLISTLAPDTFAYLGNVLFDLNLLENPFMCDCAMKGIQAWIEWKNTIQDVENFIFRCDKPLRMRSKVSNQLKPDDFICLKNDDFSSAAGIEPKTDCTPANISSAIAISVTSTILLCVLCVALFVYARKRCHDNRFRRTRSFRRDENYDDAAILKEMG